MSMTMTISCHSIFLGYVHKLSGDWNAEFGIRPVHHIRKKEMPRPVTGKSPRSAQPPHAKIQLKPHQLAIVHAMCAVEDRCHDEIIAAAAAAAPAAAAAAAPAAPPSQPKYGVLSAPDRKSVV
jgi:hypothetical protein